MSIAVTYKPAPVDAARADGARGARLEEGDSAGGAEAEWGRESIGGIAHDPRLGGGRRLQCDVGGSFGPRGGHRTGATSAAHTAGKSSVVSRING